MYSLESLIIKYIPVIVKPSPLSISRAFSSCQTETPYPLNNNSHFSLSPQPLMNTILLLVSMNFTTPGTSYTIDWIFLSVPNSYVEILIPSVMILGGDPLVVFAIMNWISTLTKETPENDLVSSVMGRHSKKMTVLAWENRLTPDTESSSALSRTSSLPKLWEMSACWL